MAFAGYSTITDARYPITHSIAQLNDRPLPPPEALFEGQDFADLRHALLKPTDATPLRYNRSTVRDGYLLIQSGADGVVFDADGKIVKESAIWADHAIEAIGPEDLKARAQPLDHAIFVGIDPGWWTFYHWFVISLSRIGLYFTAFDDGALVALAPYRDDGRMRFGRDVWTDMVDLVAPRGRTVTLADGIYHAPRIDLGWISEPQQAFVSYFHAFRSMTERMRVDLGLDQVTPSERVVLLRDSDQRLSEASQMALQHMVDHDGFSVVRAERLSIKEQAKIFAGAATITAPHGAGLCNILFADPSLKVLELNNEYDGPYVRPWFYLLAALRRQRYSYLNQTRSSFDAQQIRAMALRCVGG